MRAPGARPGALLACLACLAATLLLPGCSLFHRHRHNDVGCTRAVFSIQAQSLPPLKAPPGLSAPNTSTGVKIPTLSTPEQARARSAPCLDWPPSYVSEPPVPPTRRPTP